MVRWHNRLDEARIVASLASSALAQPYRPIMVHLIVTRRCNLRCGYCYEADRVSPPVSLDQLRERITHIQRLGALFVTLTGGEPLLHPDLPEIVSLVRQCDMIPVMNTNGYLLTAKRIEALGRAGLFALQISVDNVKPNDVTQKSLKPLLPKLRLLAKHATFRVRVNAVLGSGPPREAVEVAKTAMSLGFDAKCSFVRNAHGGLIPLDAEARAAYDEIRRLGRRAPAYLSEDFQLSLAAEGKVDFKCRAGARYFTVCEEGLVHLCESSHGYPGTPLASYQRADIERAFHMRKSCAPTCAVAYAHQASRLDTFRSQSIEGPRIEKICWEQQTARKRQANSASGSTSDSLVTLGHRPTA
jgi:MoaA/NifB/PqqE/SkfB family radical SAM enzyme